MKAREFCYIFHIWMSIPKYYIFEARGRTKKQQIFKSNYPLKITQIISKHESGLAKVVPREKLRSKPILDVKISTFKKFQIFELEGPSKKFEIFEVSKF